MSTKDIAEAIGRQLGIPTQQIADDQVADHFDWIGRFFALDLRASSEQTRRRFDWTPTHPTLLDDLDAGSYTS